MIPVSLPPENQSTNTSEHTPSPQQLTQFDRSDVKDAIKAFLLRYFVKHEISENDKQRILTDVTIVDLHKNQTILGHNEATPHFAASINKLPVTMLLIEELKANHITLDTTLTWTESDRRAGNGVYDADTAPLQATVRQVLHDMLNRSGNTAVRVLVNKVLGGATEVNNRLAQVPELTHTRLIPLEEDRFYLGNTTSKEALFVLRTIMAENASYAQLVKNSLSTNIFVEDGVRSQLAGNDFIVLANKTGLLYDPDGNNNHDVGIIYNERTQKAYGYSFLTTAPSESDTATPRAHESVKNMGRFTLRFAGDKPQQHAQPAPRTLLKQQLYVPEAKVLY